MGRENNGHLVQKKKKTVQNTKKLEALAEIRKQHLFMFYFSLVKIYIIYYTYRRVPQLGLEKANRKAHTSGGLFIKFSVKPTFRAWQLTIKARKAQ